VLLVAVLAGIAWLAFPSWRPVPPIAASATGREAPLPAPAVSAAGIAHASPSTQDPTQADHELVVRDEVETTGTGAVLVRVHYQGGAPAADVLVRVQLEQEDPLLAREAKTGADGEVRLDQVPPGSVLAYVPHDKSVRGIRGNVAAGDVTEFSLTLNQGLTVTGVVVDRRDRPIADAELVVEPLGFDFGMVVGRSQPDGSFHLRAMPADCLVGARKAGHQPSRMRMFRTGDGAEVSLRIVLEAGGGALTGIVLGPDERPVAGASIQIDTGERGFQRLPDGTMGGAQSLQTATSEPDGHFLFDSLPPGAQSIRVRAVDLAPWLDIANIEAGTTTRVIVRLTAGVTLVGTVRTSDGAPIEGADVRVGPVRDPHRRFASSAADGTFRFTGIGTESLPVHANHDKRGKAQTEIRGAPGETIRWDAVLSVGLRQRLRVIDQHGAPLPGVHVQAKHTGAGPVWGAMAATDAEGRCALLDCPPDRAIHLTLQRNTVFPEKQLTLTASTEELSIELAAPQWAYIEGRVLDPDDSPRANVHAAIVVPGQSSPIETADPKTGRFRFGPFPAGSYGLRFTCDDLPTLRIPPHALAPNETLDLGTLHFAAGGTASVQLVSDASLPLPDTRCLIYDDDGTWLDSMPFANGAGRTPPLAAGRYQLQLALEGFGSKLVPIDIRAGSEARLDVPLQHGVSCEITFAAPMDLGENIIDVVVRDAAGAIVLRRGVWRREGRRALQTWLIPGAYVLTATCQDLRGNGTFAITFAEPKQIQIELCKP